LAKKEKLPNVGGLENKGGGTGSVRKNAPPEREGLLG